MAGSHATSSSDGTSMTRHHNFKTSAGWKIVKALKEKYSVCVCYDQKLAYMSLLGLGA